MEILAEPFAILLKLLWHDGIAFLAILALSLCFGKEIQGLL